MSLLRRRQASDELDEAAVAEKKTLCTDSSDVFIQPQVRCDATPRTRTASATACSTVSKQV